jgi:DUF4097 and DUF4098 domain-containing protein YvlB
MNKHTNDSKLKLLFHVALLATLALFVQSAAAQQPDNADRVTVKLTDPARPCTLKVSLVAGSINVKGYDGKEVIVEAHSRIREREGSGAEGGMHRLNMSSTGLTVEEEHNEVRVHTDSYQRPIDVTITVPSHASLVLRSVNDGNIVVTGVDGDLDVNNTNGNVTLNNISGSALAHALNGRVVATFVHVTPQKAMAFSSMNGNIDVTFPADTKATVSLRSDNGEILTDFAIEMLPATQQGTVEDNRANGGTYRVKFDKTIRGNINAGGPEFLFKNFNGNIYIRKAGSSH